MVKTILQADETGKKTKYLVEWKDPSVSNQWLPAADHFDYPSYIAQYWRNIRPGKQRGQRDIMKVNDPVIQTGTTKKSVTAKPRSPHAADRTAQVPSTSRAKLIFFNFIF